MAASTQDEVESWMSENDVSLSLALGRELISPAEYTQIRRLAAKEMADEGKRLSRFDYDDYDRAKGEIDWLSMEWLPKEKLSDRNNAEFWGGEFSSVVANLMNIGIEKSILAQRDVLHKGLCVEFRYCERIANVPSDALTLAVAIAQWLIAAKLTLSFPIAAGSVFLVRRGLLDRLCDCANKKTNITPASVG